MTIIDRVKSSRPCLACFLKEVCSEELGDTGGELFGPSAKKKLTERAETIKAFNEALTKLDPPSGPRAAKTSTTQSRFLGRSSNTRYGSASSSHFPKPYTNHRIFRQNPHKFQRFNKPLPQSSLPYKGQRGAQHKRI